MHTWGCAEVASHLPTVHPMGMQLPGIWVPRMEYVGTKDMGTKGGGCRKEGCSTRDEGCRYQGFGYQGWRMQERRIHVPMMEDEGTRAV